MKVVKVKKDTRFDVIADPSLGIQDYGRGNDYPQSVVEISDASSTGKSCIDIYRKFVYGRGFMDEVLYELIVNNKEQSADDILNSISEDLARFGGFALHLNYNMNFQISEIQNVPFEWCRFEKLDENGKFKHILTHKDWGKRNLLNERFDKNDIKKYNIFNPKNVANEILAAGGIDNYNGQIYYFSNRGVGVYPLPIYDSVLTDMSSEEGLSNVTYRNVRNNFFPAGMVVEIAQKDQDENQSIETADTLKALQTDENVGKLMHVQVASKEEAPIIMPFEGKNYDKEFVESSKSVKDNIGRAFTQPPILRAEDVGANFGADLMENAYNFYNSITSTERFNIQREFAKILTYWWQPISVSTEILPLTYLVDKSLSEKLGDRFDKFMEILLSENPKKVQILSSMFGVDEIEINKML